MSIETNIDSSDHVFAGDDDVIRFAVVDAAGAAIDISTWGFAFVVRAEPGAADPPFIEYVLGAGIAISDGPGGEVDVTLDADDTRDNAGSYVYRLRRTDIGDGQTLAFGKLVLLEP